MDFLLIEDFGTRGLAGDLRDDGNQDEIQRRKMISIISGATSAEPWKGLQPGVDGVWGRRSFKPHPELTLFLA